MIIGLTGPIASGKSAAAKIMARRGAFVIDADKIGHEVIKPQQKAWRGIIKAFGSRVLNKGGKINRKKLASIVFANAAALKTLEHITHPEIVKAIKLKIKSARHRHLKLIVVNAAVLPQMNITSIIDKVIVVIASRQTRLKRLIKSGRSRMDALARIKSQASDSRYRSLADLVILNNGSAKDLVKKIICLISKL